MPKTQDVQIFVENSLRRSVRSGNHKFLGLLAKVLSEAGLTAQYRLMSERHTAIGLSLTHMKAPELGQGLVFRRVYHPPFWQIEQTEKRWDWSVAKATFEPELIGEKEAKRFADFWRNRHFPDLETTLGDVIYVPLQGHLLRQRSFQSCSPIDMVAAVLNATDRPVIITLHPNESYSEQEAAQLETLISRHENARLEVGGMDQHLPSCHMVVTQNSTVAFNGYFFEKPAVLFGQIDFHHIARKATVKTIGDALLEAHKLPASTYEKYLWWFWKDQSINVSRSDAKDKIKARLARFNWPVE
ncbi:MAG: hypothetical protein ABJL99_11580 [Aliishimia sp.]